MRHFAAILLSLLLCLPTKGQVFVSHSTHNECVAFGESNRLIPGTEGISLGPFVNLDGFDLTCAYLYNDSAGDYGNMSFSRLRNTNLQYARVIGTYVGADFSGANLQGAQLDGDFTGATFSQADLSGIRARLNLWSEQPFELVDLSEATVRNADLENYSFRGSDLRGADLSGSRFEGTNWGGADLRQANLSDVEFYKGNNANLADVRQVDFSSVTAPPSLYGAKYDQFTIFPTDETSVSRRWSSFDPERFAMQYVPAIPGDTDLNEAIEFADFLVLNEFYGTDCDGTPLACWKQGDFDGSGKTDFPDFLELSASFVATASENDVATVPEPNSGVSVLLILAAVLTTRRRTGNTRLPRGRIAFAVRRDDHETVGAKCRTQD